MENKTPKPDSDSSIEPTIPETVPEDVVENKNEAITVNEDELNTANLSKDNTGESEAVTINEDELTDAKLSKKDTDNSDESILIPDEIKPNEPQKPVKVKTKSSWSVRFFLFLSFVLAVTACAGGAYLYLQFMQQQSDLQLKLLKVGANPTTSSNANSSADIQALAEQNETLKTQQQTFKSQQDGLIERQQGLATQQSEIRAQQGSLSKQLKNLIDQQKSLSDLQQQLATQIQSAETQKQSVLTGQDQLTAQQKRLDEQNQAQIDELNKVLAKINSNAKRMDQLQQEMQDINVTYKPRNPDIWYITEANYLVNTANNKLLIEHDKMMAQKLLQKAIKQMSLIDNAKYADLNQALAADLAAVNAIEMTDISDTSSQITKLINQLDKLAVNETQIQPINNASKTVTSDVSDWKNNLASVWHDLTKDFFVFRETQTDIIPLLSPDQKWYVLENIRNQLSQAQLALYKYNETNYQQSLTTAKSWLEKYFDLNDATTKQTVDTIGKLSQLPLNATTVTQFESAPILKTLLETDNEGGE